MRNRYMKNERGVITILTLVTILFMIAFLLSTYVIVANRRQAQAEVKKGIQEIYGTDIENIESIYAEYFADEGEAIPIYTAEDLFKVGTGKCIVTNNKIYQCLENSDYILLSNIEFKVADYLEKNPDVFIEKTYTETITKTEMIEKETSNFSSAGNSTFEAKTGTYRLEVWGAQGGSTHTSPAHLGGVGGYSVGTITFNTATTLYVYVGGKGQTAKTSNDKYVGGYNGGGGAYLYSGTGGGASDIRIGEKTLYNRLIVAGGGSGGALWRPATAGKNRRRYFWR